MSGLSWTFVPVWLENDKCPAAKRHFRGCAREVYGYLEKIAKRHGGFVFPTVADIVRHTKKWATKNREPFSQRECERTLRTFRELGILGKRCRRKIHKRLYDGWQFYPHECWAESGGGMCEFKQWQKLEGSGYQRFREQNVGADVGADVGANVGNFI